ENLAELRQEIRQRMQRDYDAIARQRLKRALLDKLAERYDFPVPPGMVEMEFQAIWNQYQAEKERQKDAASAAQAGPAEGPIDAAALIAPEETALEGGSERSPASTQAANPPAHEHEPAAPPRLRAAGNRLLSPHPGGGK